MFRQFTPLRSATGLRHRIRLFHIWWKPLGEGVRGL
jgi:hypothetical protein